jgi:hypothetical protein
LGRKILVMRHINCAHQNFSTSPFTTIFLSMSGSDDNPIAVDGYVIIKGAINAIEDDLDLAIDETEKAIELVKPQLPNSWKATDSTLYPMIWTSKIEAVYQHFMKVRDL